MIGILTQPFDNDLKGNPKLEGYTSFIMDAYVKFIESSGARVVPIIYDKPIEENLKLLEKLNGVLYCGGISEASHYIELGRAIFNKVKSLNDQGEYYPLWGICLGFQQLATFAGEFKASRELLTIHRSIHQNIVIDYEVDPKNTKMYGPLGDDASIFEEYAMTYNSHSWGIAPADFAKSEKLSSIFKITSTSVDEAG